MSEISILVIYSLINLNIVYLQPTFSIPYHYETKFFYYLKVKNECVQVIVRCRPMSKRELENTSKSSKERSTKDEIFGNESKQVVDVYPNRGVIEIQNPSDVNRENPKMFTYDAVYDQR